MKCVMSVLVLVMCAVANSAPSQEVKKTDGHQILLTDLRMVAFESQFNSKEREPVPVRLVLALGPEVLWSPEMATDLSISIWPSITMHTFEDLKNGDVVVVARGAVNDLIDKKKLTDGKAEIYVVSAEVANKRIKNKAFDHK